jgi:hypothetical protein
VADCVWGVGAYISRYRLLKIEESC